MSRIIIYDTTLRDGSRTEGVSCSVNDKIKNTEKLDDLGVHYIEGGWPGSNPKDKEYYKHFKNKKLKNAVITAFSMTRRANITCAKDKNIQELLHSGAGTITIVGKSWDLHVKDVLRVSLDENLRMISDTVSYFKKHKKEVIYDAEHFFDGFKTNPDYALRCLTMAAEAGVLGTPFIRINDFVGRLGYLNELENKYQLGFGIKPDNIDLMFNHLNMLLLLPNCKEEWEKKKDNIFFSRRRRHTR